MGAAPHKEGELALLRDAAESPAVAQSLEAVRGLLRMDVAFVGEFAGDKQVYRVLNGDGAAFGIREGESWPLAGTFCKRIVEGDLPNLIGDVQADERTVSMAVTETSGIRSFAAAPLYFSDGQLFGTLCAAGREPREDLGVREEQLLHLFAGIVAGQLEREALQQVAQRTACEAAVTETLVEAVAARDSYTADHSREVVHDATAVARKLGLSDEEVGDVARVALLHDVGKISIPDAILKKPGPLDEAEWRIMRTHPIVGEKLISRSPGLEHLAGAIRAEHERWDGGGYPDGLAGEQIPLASRITLVCDAYHAMITDRPYRKAHSREEAWGELMLHAGTQFDPAVVEALLETLAEEKEPDPPPKKRARTIFIEPEPADAVLPALA